MKDVRCAGKIILEEALTAQGEGVKSGMPV
jgi:hypothetical protein